MKNRFDTPKDREPEKKRDTRAERIRIFKSIYYRVETTSSPEDYERKPQQTKGKK